MPRCFWSCNTPIFAWKSNNRLEVLSRLRRFFVKVAFLLIILLSTTTPVWPVIAAKQPTKPLPSPAQIAQLLGWVDEPAHACQGYFEEPRLDSRSAQVLPSDQTPVTIKAERSELSANENLSFVGNVNMAQPNRQLQADKVIIDRDPKTNHLNVAHLHGHVQWREPGNLVIADQAHVNIVDHSGELSNVIYRLTFGAFVDPEMQIDPELPRVKIHTLSRWGTAQEIQRDQAGVVNIARGSYSSCSPLAPTWLIKAKSIRLDKTAGHGTAKNATLSVHGVPVLYAPYFNFPLDRRRETGFLFPSGGHSSHSGYLFSLPFYWNIAPNYDATFTPQFMSERGVQYNGEFRYLTMNSHGNIHGSYLPNDRQFDAFQQRQLEDFTVGFPSRSRLQNDDDNRYFLSWLHSENFNDHWAAYWYYNRASDDYYFTDFHDDPAQITDNQLINEAKIRYLGDHWAFLGRVLGYQTLHPIDQSPVSNQYIKLPELIVNGQFADFHEHMQVSLNNSWVNFDKHKNPGQTMEPVTGNRLNINPGISFPFYWLAGYVNPQVQLSATQYTLNHQRVDKHEHINRSLPIFNVDSGLYLIRDFSIAENAFQQTLEPRLFYLYVPYTNQNDIPLFDTGVQPFSFDQLFRTNRFSGIDRIGDANQLAYAVTTRLLETDTGQERLHASIGQIAYFEDRRVALKESVADPTALINSVSPTHQLSPLTGEISYHLQPHWWVHSNIAWDPHSNYTNNGNLALRYQRDNQHIVNVGYHYLRGGDQYNLEEPLSSENDLNQIDLSAVWPLSEHVTSFSRLYYNIGHHSWQAMFAGLEYDSCCWAIRLVAARELRKLEYDDDLTTPDPRYTNKIYVEFSLKTLGNISPNSASTLLTESIKGYTENFGKTK
jgi:LPS-assembly protein